MNGITQREKICVTSQNVPCCTLLSWFMCPQNSVGVVFTIFVSRTYTSPHQMMRDKREQDDREKKIKIDFGCGELTTEKIERYERYLGSYNPKEYAKVDAKAVPGVDIVYRGGTSLPFKTECVDEIICIHVLEHVINLEPLMKEFHRILKPGGKLRIWVPHCFSPSAFGMPSHVRYFTYETFCPFDKSHGMSYEFDFHFKFVTSRMQVVRRWDSLSLLDKLFERAINYNQRRGERFLKVLPYKDWEVYTELQKEL
jgi:SAM-dependent methyltransferase